MAKTVGGKLMIIEDRQQAPLWKRAKVPERDYAAINNYRPEMWKLIKGHRTSFEQIVVEVGSRRGAFASGYLKHFDDDFLFCVDTWAGRRGQGDYLAWLRRVEPWLYDRCYPLHGESLFHAKVFPCMANVIFIDALHDYDNVKKDILAWYPLLVKGGLFLMHDYQQQGVKAAVDEIFPTVTTAYLGMQKAITAWVIKE